MFQAIRRMTSCLADKYASEGAYERAIRQSFLGMILFVPFKFGLDEPLVFIVSFFWLVVYVDF